MKITQTAAGEITMSILFISKDKGLIKGFSNRTYHCIAIFMLMHSKELFVANRNVTVPRKPYGSDDTTNDIVNYTNQLLANKGEYFCFHGKHLNPFDFLEWMNEHQYLFERDCRRLKIEKNRHGFIDVRGNLLQISSAFHYRFYDEALLNKWIKRAREIDAWSIETQISQHKP